MHFNELNSFLFFNVKVRKDLNIYDSNLNKIFIIYRLKKRLNNLIYYFFLFIYIIQ